MNNVRIFQYLDDAVRAVGRSRQHFAVSSQERERHHGEMLEILFALEGVRSLLGQGYPQTCFICFKELASPDDNEWHGLGNCADICTRCGGSGIDPKKEGVVSA